jgi:predicted nucleic acid-binding Zn ribbon protein
VTPRADLARQKLRQAKEDARLHLFFTGRSVSTGTRQRRGRTSAVPLGQALREMFARRGLLTEAETQMITRWRAIVGPIATHVHLAGFDPDTGTLTLCGASTAWNTQVKLLGDALIRRINEELGSQAVRRLRVVKRDSPFYGLPPDSPLRPLQTRTAREPDPAIQAALDRQASDMPGEPT